MERAIGRHSNITLFVGMQTTGATYEAGTACPSGAPEFIFGVRVARSLVLNIVFVFFSCPL